MRIPWYLGNSNDWQMPSFFIPLMIWSAVWTGLALWHAARRGEKWWFILFILIHTAGILEIIYLVFVAKALVTNKPPSKRRKRA